MRTADPGERRILSSSSSSGDLSRTSHLVMLTARGMSIRSFGLRFRLCLRMMLQMEFKVSVMSEPMGGRLSMCMRSLTYLSWSGSTR